MVGCRVGCQLLSVGLGGWVGLVGLRKRIEAELKGTAKAEAHRAVERQAKRTRSKALEGENQQRTQGKRQGRQMKECQRRDSAGAAAAAVQWEASKPEDSEERDRTDKKRKAGEEHPVDPHRGRSGHGGSRWNARCRRRGSATERFEFGSLQEAMSRGG